MHPFWWLLIGVIVGIGVGYGFRGFIRRTGKKLPGVD